MEQAGKIQWNPYNHLSAERIETGEPKELTEGAMAQKSLGNPYVSLLKIIMLGVRGIFRNSILGQGPGCIAPLLCWIINPMASSLGQC